MNFPMHFIMKNTDFKQMPELLVTRHFFNEKKNRIILKGDVPSPMNPPSGCRFHTRCFKCTEICSKEEPKFQDLGGGHFVACWNL